MTASDAQAGGMSAARKLFEILNPIALEDVLTVGTIQQALRDTGFVHESELALLRAQNAKLVEALKRVDEQLSEGFHTALRKGSDHPKAHAAWTALADLPEREWAAVMEFVLEGLGVRAALRDAGQ